MSTRLDLFEQGAGATRVFASGDKYGGFDYVEKMVGRASPLAGARLRRANLKLTVESDGVAINDFPLKLFCEDERKRGFTTCSRAENHDQQRVVLYVQRQLQWIACQKRTSVMPSRVAAMMSSPVVSSA